MRIEFALAIRDAQVGERWTLLMELSILQRGFSNPNVFCFMSSYMPLSVNRTYSPVASSIPKEGDADGQPRGRKHMYMTQAATAWKRWMFESSVMAMKSCGVHNFPLFTKERQYVANVGFVMPAHSDIDNRLKILYDSMQGCVYEKDARIFVQSTRKIQCRKKASGFYVIVYPRELEYTVMLSHLEFFCHEDGDAKVAEAFLSGRLASIGNRLLEAIPDTVANGEAACNS